MNESQEVTAGWSGLFEQAPMTAAEYFYRAQRTLEGSGLKFTAADVVALARIAAADMHTAGMCIAAQKVARAVDGLADAVRDAGEA